MRINEDLARICYHEAESDPHGCLAGRTGERPRLQPADDAGGLMDVAMPVVCPPRRREPEWMDQPGLDGDLHLAALVGLRRINFLSRTAGALWSPIKRLALTEPARHWRVLDVACGGGDVSVAIARRARTHSLHITVDGCDLSHTAVAHATMQAAASHLEDLRFFEHDALARDLPPGYDVVMCSLFLHHFDENDAVTLLRRMADAAGRLVLVSDLRRSRTGNLLAWLTCHLVTRSPVVHIDGPRSARAAFSLVEARDLAARSGLEGAGLRRCWPQRFLLQWQRPCQP
jgi:2-polyprenyl-3-methyl-5-hydroxy-6-metoxy-1,4-benzoquinol methylase